MTRVAQTQHLAMTVRELMDALATIPDHKMVHLSVDASGYCPNLFAVFDGEVVTLSSRMENDPDEEEGDDEE